jgi:puromycin-sensitive aminopeptidase
VISFFSFSKYIFYFFYFYQVLKLIDAYRNEDNYTVWSSITNSLVKLQVLLSHTDLSQQFDAYGIHLYRPVAEKLGWNAKPNEVHLDTLLRTLVLSRLVSFNCPKTVAEAKKR